MNETKEMTDRGREGCAHEWARCEDFCWCQQCPIDDNCCFGDDDAVFCKKCGELKKEDGK